MKLRVDGEYALYGGDRIRCLKDEGGGLFTCEFVSVVPFRAELMGQCDQWTSTGKWAVMPYGVFDVDREVEP